MKRQSPIPTSSKSLQTPRASSSLGKNHHQSDTIHISPTNSNNSNDSVERSISPQIRSPPLPSSLSSHLQQQSTSTTTATTNMRKTRVPALHRKKSAIGLISKRKPHFMTLIQNDDIMLRADGFIQLSKRLSVLPYTPIINLNSIQIDIPNSPPIDGEGLKSLILSQWEENYEVLSSWDCVTNIMIKLLSFEEYVPKLILDARLDESNRRSESDISKHRFANLALVRAKLYLQCENPDLVDILFTSLVQYGGFVASSNTATNKKDLTRLPANRRKLTKEFLEWMDELVTPLIGLNEDIDYTEKAYEGVPDSYTVDYIEKSSNTASWFESDDNVRQCLAILLPWTISTSGTIWHLPLITFIKHVRLLNQRLFEMVTATYDDTSVSKICRTLGIHIRVEAPITVAASISPVPIETVEEDEEEEEYIVDNVIDNEKDIIDTEEHLVDNLIDNDTHIIHNEDGDITDTINTEGVGNFAQNELEPEINQFDNILIEESIDQENIEYPIENEVKGSSIPINQVEELTLEPEYPIKEVEAEPNTKLSIQERSLILDHLPTLDNTDSNQDYFSLNSKDSIIRIKDKDEPTIHNDVCQEYNEKTTSIDDLAESDILVNIVCIY